MNLEFYSSFMQGGRRLEVEKKFACEICGKKFVNKHVLKTHKLGQHEGKKMFACVCGETFKWAYIRNEHKKNCQFYLAGSKSPMESQSKPAGNESNIQDPVDTGETSMGQPDHQSYDVIKDGDLADFLEENFKPDKS